MGIGAGARRVAALATLISCWLTTAAVSAQTDYKPPEPEPEPQPAPAPASGSAGASASSDGGGSSSSGGSSRRKAAELMPPATKPWYLTAGVGPTFFGLTRGGKNPKAGGPGALRRERFMVALDLGYHFSGELEGPAIGLAIEQSFDGDFYAFNPAFKFLWDIQLFDDLGVYIAPFGKAGYALGCDYGGCSTVHAFNVGLGVEGRIVFNDFPIVFLRPVQVDSFIGDFYDEVFLLNYTILVGGGMTF